MGGTVIFFFSVDEVLLSVGEIFFSSVFSAMKAFTVHATKFSIVPLCSVLWKPLFLLPEMYSVQEILPQERPISHQGWVNPLGGPGAKLSCGPIFTGPLSI